MKSVIKKIDNMNCSIREFSNLQEVENYIKTTPRISLFEACNYSEHTNNLKWYGTSSFDEALKLLKTGWTDKSKELEEKLSKKFSVENTQVIRQKSVYDVVGGNASVPRYLQGVPTNMIRQVRTPVKEKVVTINYNIGFNCSISADEITRKAIRCLSYTKQLEDSGTRVNLNVVFVSNRETDYITFIVPVKKSSERLSIAKLSFCLCNASMLRRIGFALIERERALEEMKYGSKFVSTYGRILSSIGAKAEEKRALDTILCDKNMKIYED